MMDEFNFGHIGYVIIISLVDLFGILASVFIVVVNLLDWAKSKSLSTCDHILLILGISSTFFLFIIAAETYLYFHEIDVHGLDYIFLVLFQLEIWWSSSSFSLTSCLCVFFCLKIVDFNHHLFIWLKLRISKVVSCLMLDSVVGSLVLSIPAYWSTSKVCSQNTTIDFFGNCTVGQCELELTESYRIFSMVFGFCVPLLLNMASTSVILLSLFSHTRQMKNIESGFSQPRLEAHFGAAKLVGALLLICFFTFLAIFVRLCAPSNLVETIVWLIITSCFSVQSFTLILGNTKLKNVLCKLLSARHL